MRKKPSRHIDINAVKYWRYKSIIHSFFLLIILTACYFAARIWDWPQWIIMALLSLTLVLAIFNIFFKPGIIWRNWRYDVTEQEIDLFYGIFIKKRTLIPMVRVQHVDTEQGPLLRHFDLSTVSISTAAGTHKIPALSDNVASSLRDAISELARVVDEDV